MVYAGYDRLWTALNVVFVMVARSQSGAWLNSTGTLPVKSTSKTKMKDVSRDVPMLLPVIHGKSRKESANENTMPYSQSLREQTVENSCLAHVAEEAFGLNVTAERRPRRFKIPPRE